MVTQMEMLLQGRVPSVPLRHLVSGGQIILQGSRLLIPVVSQARGQLLCNLHKSVLLPLLNIPTLVDHPKKDLVEPSIHKERILHQVAHHLSGTQTDVRHIG